MRDNSFKYAEDMETYRYLKMLKDREEKSLSIQKQNISVVGVDINMDGLSETVIMDLNTKSINKELFEDVMMSALSYMGNTEYMYFKTLWLESFECNKGDEYTPTTFSFKAKAQTTTDSDVVVIVENVDVEDKYNKPKIKIKKHEPLVSFMDYLNAVE